MATVHLKLGMCSSGRFHVLHHGRLQLIVFNTSLAALGLYRAITLLVGNFSTLCTTTTASGRRKGFARFNTRSQQDKLQTHLEWKQERQQLKHLQMDVQLPIFTYPILAPMGSTHSQSRLHKQRLLSPTNVDLCWDSMVQLYHLH